MVYSQTKKTASIASITNQNQGFGNIWMFATDSREFSGQNGIIKVQQCLVLVSFKHFSFIYFISSSFYWYYWKPYFYPNI